MCQAACHGLLNSVTAVCMLLSLVPPNNGTHQSLRGADGAAPNEADTEFELLLKWMTSFLSRETLQKGLDFCRKKQRADGSWEG